MSVLPGSMVIERPEEDNLKTLRKEDFCEYAYDFENNELKLKNGKHYYVYGNEAMKIWIYKAMITSRYRYSAYTDSFGTEIYTLIGEVISNETKKAEIKRYITEAIMVHPFMKAITDIQLRRYKSGVEATVYYQTVFSDKVVNVSCEVPIE